MSHIESPPEQYKIIDPFSEDVYTNTNLVTKIFHPTIETDVAEPALQFPLKDLTGVAFNFHTGRDDNLYPSHLESAEAYITPGYLCINNIFMYLEDPILTDFKTRLTANWFRATDCSTYAFGLNGTTGLITTRSYPSFNPVVHIVAKYDVSVDEGASIGYVFSDDDYTTLGISSPIDISDKSKYCILGTNKMEWIYLEPYKWFRKWTYEAFDHPDLMNTDLYPRRDIVPKYVEYELRLLEKLMYRSTFDMNEPI